MEIIQVAASPAVCVGDVDDQHPRIYLNLDLSFETICPYCSRHFSLRS